MNKLPTSNFEMFKKQIQNPNKPFDNCYQDNIHEKIKILKNIVLSYPSDSSGCGNIRNIFPMTYLNAEFGKTKKLSMLLSPVMIYQQDILQRTRSIFFQRSMSPRQIPPIKKYMDLKDRYRYKMIHDIDDFIWLGNDEGESLPNYNFASEKITDDMRTASVEIMKMMDICCVSTDFLKNYIHHLGVDKNKIRVVPNCVPRYFWNRPEKEPIMDRIKKPSFIYTGSPTHYNNPKKLAGDLDNAWTEWIIKSVNSNKIDFYCMGGLPFVFESIKDKINIIPWINSYQYHLAVLDISADFSIGPLVPNYFNYSKSDIKYKEACASGSAFIGSIFPNTGNTPYGFKKTSPYDICELKLPYDCSVNDIDVLIDEYCEPNNYNKVIKAQYDYMYTGGWYLESPKYIKMLTEIF
ncbi:MAG: hypothetical protein WC260_01755 [Candidatus Pacearchaeota archaeon]